MSSINAEGFFRYARERYAILLRKRGGTTPFGPDLTKDPILQRYRFCNVFREDDRTTTWFRENVREPMAEDLRVLQATVIFRWFNKIETGMVLLEHDLFRYWDGRQAVRVLKDLNPITNGAYIIKTPDGMDKLHGVVQCIDWFMHLGSVTARSLTDRPCSLETATKMLAEYKFLGNFMAYEVVTDLRHTRLLCRAPDIRSWANPGPGAARGASRVLGLEPGHLNCNSQRDRENLQWVMSELLELSWDDGLWPHDRPWEMREVEHTLCEFDKYERARLGEGRPKQLYHRGHRFKTTTKLGDRA